MAAVRSLFLWQVPWKLQPEASWLGHQDRPGLFTGASTIVTTFAMLRAATGARFAAQSLSTFVLQTQRDPQRQGGTSTYPRKHHMIHATQCGYHKERPLAFVAYAFPSLHDPLSKQLSLQSFIWHPSPVHSPRQLHTLFIHDPCPSFHSWTTCRLTTIRSSP